MYTTSSSFTSSDAPLLRSFQFVPVPNLSCPLRPNGKSFPRGPSRSDVSTVNSLYPSTPLSLSPSRPFLEGSSTSFSFTSLYLPPVTQTPDPSHPRRPTRDDPGRSGSRHSKETLIFPLQSLVSDGRSVFAARSRQGACT